MNGFRLVDGFEDELFAARTGLDAASLERALAPLQARGLLERTPGHWRATPKGFRFLNDILVELLPETAQPRDQSLTPCSERERFYAQTPHPGPLNKGITPRFNSVAG